jgi:hypothetical protein
MANVHRRNGTDDRATKAPYRNLVTAALDGTLQIAVPSDAHLSPGGRLRNHGPGTGEGLSRVFLQDNFLQLL